MPNSNTPNILIVGPSWVGDMVMAQSLFKALKQQHPDCTLDVLAPAWSKPLLARMPEVRQSWEQPLGHGKIDLATRYCLGKSLRNQHYQQAIVLPNSWKSAIPVWSAKIPQRTGYIGEFRYGLLNDARRLDKQILGRTVERFVALAAAQQPQQAPDIPQPKLDIDAANSAAAVQQLGLSTERKILALCPGAEYGPAKRWPSQHFVDLAAPLIREGWQVWLFGSDKDRPVGTEIQHGLGEHCHNLCGKTQLAEALDLMALAQAVVSNDSGLMHVAAALDKPLVALYGSSDPNFTPPLHPQAQIASLNLECSPCFKRECPLGHLRCLEDLSPASVSAKLMTLF